MRDFRFICALSEKPGRLQKFLSLIRENDLEDFLLSDILVSPLFLSPKAVEMILALKDEMGDKLNLFFDSGGYQVQQGRIDPYVLYDRLKRFVDLHPIADRFVLPDCPATSSDSADVADQKVLLTLKHSQDFFRQLPDDLKPKAMGVVHGKSKRTVNYCLEAYFDLGLSHVGFGGFATGGKNSQTNLITARVIPLVHHVAQACHAQGVSVHFFGVGSPSLIARIYGLGADTFDSASYMSHAYLGKVVFPFMRGYSISDKIVDDFLSKEKFLELKDLTQHHCPFCADFEFLVSSRPHRVLHNLMCVKESVKMIRESSLELIKHIYDNGSKLYLKEFDRYLNVMDPLAFKRKPRVKKK